MPVLQDRDFDKLAEKIVDSFLANGGTLTELAAKEAKHAGLNPDQIERVAQAANTQTFLKLMDQRKQAGEDLLHEFDPIDARHVIKLIIDDTGAHVLPVTPEDMAALPNAQSIPAEMNELPDEMAAARHPVTDDLNVVQPDEEADSKKKVQKAASANDILRMRKLAAIMTDERQQAEIAFDETFSKLAASFKRLYGPKFLDFEKDAMAEHDSDTALAILNNLRSQLRLPSRDKIAALTNHVSDESPELELFEKLIKVANEAAKLDEGLLWVRAQCK